MPAEPSVLPVGLAVSDQLEVTMLTRLEVDGFKNLLDFSLDLGPFNCIAGPNGVGKSNIFDAIQLLSLLADHSLIEAALSVRGSDPETSNLQDLFWTDGNRHVDHFSIAAEMLVEPEVEDDFRRAVTATSTFLRYEVKIGYEPSEQRGKTGRLVLLKETLDPITEGEAAGRLKFPHKASTFRRTVVRNRRRSKNGYISTIEPPHGPTEILVAQDGGSRGSPQKAPADTAPRTIVATANTSTTPTILAARREMQKWRVLALEPSAMRRADRFHSEPSISAGGAHLPATLHRLATTTDGPKPDPERVFTKIAGRLAELVPILSLHVDIDEVRQLLTLQAVEKGGMRLPARSLSDGTLRFLTLCVLAEDPSYRGVICMEEPENGIHPEKMQAMVDLLRDLAVDPEQAPGPDNPMRQVILATHSPWFVQLQNRSDLLAALTTRLRGPFGKPTSTIRCRPQSGTWRSRGNEMGIGLGTILAYLTTPPGAQIRLPHMDPQ